MEQMFISGSKNVWNQRFHKWKAQIYNLMVQAISRGGGDCAAKVQSLCSCFVYMGSPVKTQVKNVLNKIFNLRVQTIDLSDQAVFILKYLVLHDE